MRKIVIKIIVLAVIAVAYKAILFGDAMKQFLFPMIVNDLAIKQMENTATSSLGIQIYTYASNYSWIVLLLIAVIVLHKDIINIFKTKKENFNNEN